jgi:hypothetical protein
MAIEIVDLPIKNGGSFHSYVSLPEGIPCFSSPGLRDDEMRRLIQQVCSNVRSWQTLEMFMILVCYILKKTVI